MCKSAMDTTTKLPSAPAHSNGANGTHHASSSAQSITSCFSCPIGRASSVGKGGMCPWVTRQRRAGELLYLQGEPAHTIWFIKKGTVVLTRALGEVDGREGAHAVRASGSFLGLEALIRSNYLHQARTVTPAAVCGATKETVDSWLGTPGSPARSALEQVLKMYAHDTPRGASPDGTAVRRVARWICDEAQDGVAPPIPRRVVASLLGMTPETFSRALAALAARELIDLTRKRLTIRNTPALRAEAGL